MIKHKINHRDHRWTEEIVYWTQINADYKDFKYKEITAKIINIFYAVYNKLGYGFLEKVYENAMMIEFKKEEISAENQGGKEISRLSQIFKIFIKSFLICENLRPCINSLWFLWLVFDNTPEIT